MHDLLTFSAARMNWVARYCTQRLLVRQMGDMHDPRTWMIVGEMIACACLRGRRRNGQDALSYEPGVYEHHGNGIGALVFDDTLPLAMQARIIVHELAHHLLHTLTPDYLGGKWFRGFDCEQREQIHDQIACLVVQMCFDRRSDFAGWPLTFEVQPEVSYVRQ